MPGTNGSCLAIAPGLCAILASVCALFPSANIVAGSEDATGFDLLANAHLAHLRRSGCLMVDLGTPSRHIHTMSDWRSGWKGDLQEKEHRYSDIVKPSASLWFVAPPDQPGGGVIEIVGRAGKRASAQVLLNGIDIGKARFSDDSFSSAELDFDAGITTGLNELKLIPADGQVNPWSDSFLSIDKIVIAPANEFSCLGDVFCDETAQSVDPNNGLAISDGDSYTHYLVLPRFETILILEATALDEGDHALVTISVRSDESESPVEFSLHVGRRSADAALSLSAFRGHAVEISISAESGKILLTRAELLYEHADPIAASPEPYKNMLWILVDTLRADRLKAYNPHSHVKATAFNRFGKRGVVFENAMAPASWTKPSVASLLTGLYPDSHTVVRHESVLPASVPFASEIYRASGFETAAFLGNGYISREHGFYRGWDYRQAFGKGNASNTAGSIVNSAIRWMKNRNRSRRFFAYVHLVDPHAPYAAPDKYRFLYAKPQYRGQIRPHMTAALLRDFFFGIRSSNDIDTQRLEQLYNGEVTYNDRHLARLLKALASVGMARNTAVVLTSDHGEEFMDHGGLGHGHTLHEELVHIPLFFILPRSIRNPVFRIETEVSLTDVLSTSCDLLDVACPMGEGRSLAPLLTGKQKTLWTASFSALENVDHRAVRWGRYKGIFKESDFFLACDN